jgi:2-polyprenyl-3-methyl-5-hydroxy-6-metoxy-1,4-benzoquinol methylase
MKKAEDLYGSEYCLNNSKKLWRYSVVPKVVRILFEHFKPCSMIDFGCANGLHVANFKDLGVECFGVEGTLHYRKYIEENYDGEYAIADLRLPFDLRRTFELAICIEVLEHLDKYFAGIAAENICRHSDVLCITASAVNNARYHVNGQDKAYWVEMFESILNFEFKESETEDLQNKFKNLEDSPSWMRENLMVFRR